MSEPTELEKAQAIVNAYRCTIAKSSPADYMAYMRARAVLDKFQNERFTAGQRGFMAATSKPLIGTDQ